MRKAHGARARGPGLGRKDGIPPRGHLEAATTPKNSEMAPGQPLNVRITIRSTNHRPRPYHLAMGVPRRRQNGGRRNAFSDFWGTVPPGRRPFAFELVKRWISRLRHRIRQSRLPHLQVSGIVPPRRTTKTSRHPISTLSPTRKLRRTDQGMQAHLFEVIQSDRRPRMRFQSSTIEPRERHCSGMTPRPGTSGAENAEIGSQSSRIPSPTSPSSSPS